jgi:hypothetical protein
MMLVRTKDVLPESRVRHHPHPRAFAACIAFVPYFWFAVDRGEFDHSHLDDLLRRQAQQVQVQISRKMGNAL